MERPPADAAACTPADVPDTVGNHTGRHDALVPGPAEPLAGVAAGDALLIVALVPAPALRPAVSPEADSVLHESLRHILEEAVSTDARVCAWPHGQFLAVLPRTTRADAISVAGEVRRRWRCSWTAPVAVASGVSAVDHATPASTAAMLAGAEVSAAKERVAHS